MHADIHAYIHTFPKMSYLKMMKGCVHVYMLHLGYIHTHIHTFIHTYIFRAALSQDDEGVHELVQEIEALLQVCEHMHVYMWVYIYA
jgi:hypothetical protein